jgi:hypothetical protein
VSNYKSQLWDEIARNDPPMAKFINDMREFKPKLNTFRWLKEPRVVMCSYHRKVES